MTTEEEKEYQLYEALTAAVRDAIAETIDEHGGSAKSSIIEGAIGYNLSMLFDNYPREIRGAAIEYFCKNLREAPQLDTLN